MAITTTPALDRFIADQMAARPIEVDIIRRIHAALDQAGMPIVRAFDGTDNEQVSTLQDIYMIAFNLDEVILYTASGLAVYLVMGEGYEMLCNYSVRLGEALAPVNAYIESKW